MPQKRKNIVDNTPPKKQKFIKKSPPILCRQNAFNFGVINNDNINSN